MAEEEKVPSSESTVDLNGWPCHQGDVMKFGTYEFTVCSIDSELVYGERHDMLRDSELDGYWAEECTHVKDPLDELTSDSWPKLCSFDEWRKRIAEAWRGERAKAESVKGLLVESRDKWRDYAFEEADRANGRQDSPERPDGPEEMETIPLDDPLGELRHSMWSDETFCDWRKRLADAWQAERWQFEGTVRDLEATRGDLQHRLATERIENQDLQKSLEERERELDIVDCELQRQRELNDELKERMAKMTEPPTRCRDCRHDGTDSCPVWIASQQLGGIAKRLQCCREGFCAWGEPKKETDNA